MHWPDRGDGLFETGAPDQRVRTILRFRVEITFIQCERLSAAEENFAIDDDGVGAAAVRAINEICNWIVNRLPLRAHDVEQRDIGLLAEFKRTKVLVPLHAARTVDRQHLNCRLGAKHLGVEARFMQSTNNEKGLPNRIQVVARHGRIRAQRHGKTELEHFGRLPVADIAHGLMHGRAWRERNLHIPLFQHVQLLCIHPAHVEQQHVVSEQPQLFQPSDISHAVFQMRSDGFIAILAGMTDDADTTLLSEPAQSAQEVVRTCDRYANGEPGLEAAVQ
jgi:hypothetical protein